MAKKKQEDDEKKRKEDNVRRTQTLLFNGENFPSDEEEDDLKFFGQSKPKTLSDYLVVSKSNKLYFYWNFFLTLVCISSSIIYAYYAAFRYDIEANHNNPDSLRYQAAHEKFNFSQKQINTMDYMMYVIEII